MDTLRPSVGDGALRWWPQTDEAKVIEEIQRLKAHHQRDEALIVQRTEAVRHLEAEVRRLKCVLESIVRGDYAPEAHKHHPAVALARKALIQ